MSELAVSVQGVSKRFRMYRERNQTIKAALVRGGRSQFEEFWALRDVSVAIPKGTTYGLIGENGSGKSTLLKCVARILRPDGGTVTANGTLAALLELGSGFHPELSGRENVFLNASILGMKKSAIEASFDHIVDFAGIGEFIDQPVKNYSSGMYVRLGFSIAINIDPDILLVDEILAVGDVNFQDKCMEKFSEFRRRGKTVIIVSHAMSAMRSMCDEVTWLEHGRVVENGRAAELVDNYSDSAHVERHEELDGGGTRLGSGEIQVSKVAMLDRSGAPMTQFRTGDPVTLRMEYEASEPIERPVFGFAMETHEGVIIWENNTLFGNGHTVPLAEGHGVVELAVPQLMLQTGTYDLHAVIVDHTSTHIYDLFRQTVRFDVLTGNPRESGGILILGGSWSGHQSGSLAE
jgi:ABC-2 type transport system ATP-binding protein